MASERVERVIRGYEAFNRGDLDAAVEGFHPDIEWRGPDLLPEDETYQGREGVRRFWERWHDVFDDFRVEIEETSEIGESVLVMARVRGRGKDSGAEVSTPSFAHVWKFKDQQAASMQMYQSRVAALEALGADAGGAR